MVPDLVPDHARWAFPMVPTDLGVAAALAAALASGVRIVTPIFCRPQRLWLIACGCAASIIVPSENNTYTATQTMYAPHRPASIFEQAPSLEDIHRRWQMVLLARQTGIRGRLNFELMSPVLTGCSRGI